MSRLDALPADQKSVLQLLLRQGKGYDDLSGLLRLDADEVRSRAYDALDTLGPGAGGLPAERRHEIADWLLGQQEPDEAVATRAFIDGSTAGRVWAHGVARELEPLAGDRLPELPAEARGDRPTPTPSADDAGGRRHSLRPGPDRRARASRAAAARCSSAACSPPSPIAVVLVIVLTRRRRQEGRQHGDPGRQHHLDRGPAAGPRADQPHAAQGRAGQEGVAIVQIVDVNGQHGDQRRHPGPADVQQEGRLRRCGSTTARRRPSSSAASTRPTTRATSSCRAQLPKDVDIASYKDLVITRETEHATRRRRARSTCAGRSRAPPAARPTAAACRGS